MQKLFLREVTKADAKLLLEWRNESSVRENSFHSEIIAYKDHVNWLSGKLEELMLAEGEQKILVSTDEVIEIVSVEEVPAEEVPAEEVLAEEVTEA